MKETTSFLTGLTSASSGSSDQPTSPQLFAEPTEEKRHKRRRFSTDTINDLLFWGAHLCIVAVSLAIVWSKLDQNTRVLRLVLDAQGKEVAIMQRQVAAVESQSKLVRDQEDARTSQSRANAEALSGLIMGMANVQSDTARTLEQTKTISQSVLEVSQNVLVIATANKAVTQQAVSAANSAAGAAASAAGAAARAASRTGATQSLVQSKVVTSADKVRIQQEQVALAAKRKQLNKTIRQVRKNGPNLIQQLFH